MTCLLEGFMVMSLRGFDRVLLGEDNSDLPQRWVYVNIVSEGLIGCFLLERTVTFLIEGFMFISVV